MVLENAKNIAKWLFEIGAARVDLLDVRQKNQEFDYMVLSCTAQAQGAKLIAQELIKFAEKNNIQLQRAEGMFKGDWIVLDFDEFVVTSKQLSFYDTGVSAEYGDELITLATCEYSNPDSRLVVVAKKV